MQYVILRRSVIHSKKGRPRVQPTATLSADSTRISQRPVAAEGRCEWRPKDAAERDQSLAWRMRDLQGCVSL